MSVQDMYDAMMPEDNDAAGEEFDAEVQELLAGDYAPFEPENFAEAMGEIPLSVWSAIAYNYTNGTDANVAPLLRVFASEYWDSLATSEVIRRTNHRNDEARAI